MLSFQAVLFYAPHWIWKMLEDRRMEVRGCVTQKVNVPSFSFQRIISGLNQAIENDTDRGKKVDQLSSYMIERMQFCRYEHQQWALKFFFCECLNLVNVLLQIKFTDTFLGGAFSKFGTEVCF